MKYYKDFLKGLTRGFLYFGIIRFIITAITLMVKREFHLITSLTIEAMNVIGYFILFKRQLFNKYEIFALCLILLINLITIVIVLNLLINLSDSFLIYPNIANLIYFLYGFFIFSVALWKRKSPLL